MIEKTLEQYPDWAQMLLDWVRGVGDFVQTQAPALANEIIAWGLARSVIMIWIFSIAAVIGFLLIGLAVALDDYDASPPCFVLGTAIIIASSIFLVSNILTYYQVKTAPRLYLLEEASKLVRDAT